MSYVMTAKALADKCVDIARNYKTLYVMGCFGAPMTEKNKQRYINNGTADGYNARPERKAMIEAASADTFGFDCVNLIKGILWGWCGDKNATYGGAKYNSNGVPDVSANGMIKLCTGVTNDFLEMDVGEALWCEGHIGVYIGNGLAVECTPKWANKVQITAVGNLGTVRGYNTRCWSKHGYLPWVDYTQNDDDKEVITMDLTPEQLNERIDERAGEIAEKQIKEVLGSYIHEIDEIPHDSVKKEMRVLLDCGAVNGGTSAAVNPDDINLPYNLVRTLVMAARYTDIIKNQ